MVALREWAEAASDGSRPDTFQRDTDAPGEFLQHGFIAGAEMRRRSPRQRNRSRHRATYRERGDEETANAVPSSNVAHRHTHITPYVGTPKAAPRCDHVTVEAVGDGERLLYDDTTGAEYADEVQAVTTARPHGYRRERVPAKMRGFTHHPTEHVVGSPSGYNICDRLADTLNVCCG